MEFWGLPGPDDFLSRVQDDLRGGKNVLLAQPRFTVPSAAESLHASLGLDGWYVSRHAADSTDAPVTTVARALGIEEHRLRSRSCVSLCREQECQQGRILIMEGIDGENRAEWRRFIGEYERACREVPEAARTLLVIVLNERSLEDFARRDVALSHRLFDGVVTEVDMLVYATRRLIGREDNLRRRALLATSVSRVALWDVALADQLLEAPFEQILEPGEVLLEYAGSLGWDKGDNPDWSAGTLGMWNGTKDLHSSYLATRDETAAIDRRLWSAQASIFLPEIERLRLALVPEAERHMRGPFDTPMGRVQQVADLEIGALCHYAHKSNAPSGLKDRLAALADARNDLAHLRRLAPTAALYGSLV